MKLRIQENTLRIRVNEKEVDMLANGATLSSETTFPENSLRFTLLVSDGQAVSLSKTEVKITLNRMEVETWALSSEVSIAMVFEVSNDKKLSILVEKDMKV